MSTATLSSLLDYLTGTLSASNLRWVGEHLIEYANKEEDSTLKRYTMEELYSMIDQAEANIAAGRTTSHEESMQNWKAKIARKEQYAREKAEAIWESNGMSIYIVAFWDTRQEPEAQASRTN